MDDNSISFSRGALRALMSFGREDQTRVHLWIDQLRTTLGQGDLPEDTSGKNEGATENEVATKLTPYDGPLVGVDLDERVHVVCALTEKSCSILTLNMADNIDF
jgi:hypothetical protein